MELRQIRYFLTLCEEQSFTRSAQRCGVAQPTLSKAIKLLEHELGGPLFQRLRAGAVLTPLGAAVRRHFLDIERSVAAAKSEAGLMSAKTIHTAVLAKGVCHVE